MSPPGKTAPPGSPGEQLREKLARFADYIASHGLKSTRQRNAVAEVFFGSEAHLTIEEVLELVRRQDPQIGYATVYRTLKLLAEAGLAAERHFDNGVARYEQTLGQAHHDHMVCTGCGKVIEFVNQEIEELQESVAIRYGFEMTSHKLELYGLCSACREAPAGRSR